MARSATVRPALEVVRGCAASWGDTAVAVKRLLTMKVRVNGVIPVTLPTTSWTPSLAQT